MNPTETPSSAPALLEYGAVTPWHRRRRVRILALAILCVAVAVIVAIPFGQNIYLHVDMLRWQREVEHFSLPPTTLAYREDGPYTASLSTTSVGKTHILFAMPLRYEKVTLHQDVVELLPMCIDRFDGRRTRVFGASSGTFRNSPTYFLHRRRAPGGEWRIVYVTGYPLSRLFPGTPPASEGKTWPILYANAYKPATWSTNLAQTSGVARGELRAGHLANVPAGDLSFFFGQPDPNDDSHFTIEYKTPTTRGVIDGYLKADDVVKIQFRAPPATGGTR